MRNEAAVSVLTKCLSNSRPVSIDAMVEAIGYLVVKPKLSSEEFMLIKKIIRDQVLSENISAEPVVKILKSVSQLPQPDQLGITADILSHLGSRSIASSVSSNDALMVMKICSRMKIFDSDLFEKLGAKISLQTMQELKQFLAAMNRLKHVVKNVSVADSVEKLRDAVVCADLTSTAVPLLEYTCRSGTNLNGMVNVVMENLANKMEISEGNEELLKQRSLVSLDNAFSIITLLGQLGRRNQFVPTNKHKEQIKWMMSKVLTFELRNLSLQQLMKLYFSLYQMDTFDDFFVRRRLVPAVFHMYKNSTVKKPKDTTLVLMMLSQLPFKNPMTDELLNMAVNDAQTIKPNSEYYEAVHNVIHRVTS